MPKKDTAHLDPRTDIKLANGKPLKPAIPKENLRKAAEKLGTQRDLAQKLSTDKRPISERMISDWIGGRRTMGNRDVIHAAHVLDVSPLAILDLCDPDESEAPRAEDIRRLLSDLLQRFASGRDLLLSSTVETEGDYRDLRQLAIDAAQYYAERCDSQGTSDLLRSIVDAGRRHAPRADQGGT